MIDTMKGPNDGGDVQSFREQDKTSVGWINPELSGTACKRAAPNAVERR